MTVIGVIVCIIFIATFFSYADDQDTEEEDETEDVDSVTTKCKHCGAPQSGLCGYCGTQNSVPAQVAHQSIEDVVDQLVQCDDDEARVSVLEACDDIQAITVAQLTDVAACFDDDEGRLQAVCVLQDRVTRTPGDRISALLGTFDDDEGRVGEAHSS